MTLRVVPEGLTSAADLGSLQTAAGFVAQGTEHAAEGVEEVGRAGVGVGESGVSYAAAGTYGGV